MLTILTSCLRSVAAAVRAAGGLSKPPDDQTWKDKVARPAIHLARTSLPLLSRGWGNTLVMVWIGYFAFTVGWLGEVISKRDLLQGDLAGRFAWSLKFIFMLVSAAIPIAFSNAPAKVSTQCDDFKNNLALLRGEEIMHSSDATATRIDALFNMLDHVSLIDLYLTPSRPLIDP